MTSGRSIRPIYSRAHPPGLSFLERRSTTDVVAQYQGMMLRGARMVDEARLRQKLRVEDLAQRMGFKQESSVSAYLRGRRTPKPATLVRYCQAVGLRAFLEIRGENETMVMVRLGDWGNANLLALMKISRPFGLRIALRIVQVP